MAIDKLINSSQGDSIISLLGGGSGATSIADSLATIAAKSNTPYNTDNKLNTQYTILTDYAKASAAQAIASSDNVPTALGKLEYKVDTNTEDINTNKNNILFNTDNGVKNVLNFTLNHQSGTVVFDNIGNNTVQLTSSAATSAQVTCALYTGEMSADYYAIKVVASGITLANDNVFVNVVYDIDGGATNQNQNVTDVLVFRNNKIIIKGVYVYVRSGKQPNGTIQVMICPTNLYDVSSKMIPYAMSNAELTAAIQALQAQLANQ